MRPLIAMTMLSVVVGTTLAACGRSPSGTIGPAPRPVAIDGTYGGVMRLSRGQAVNCGDSDPITVHVKNHAFSYRLHQPQADWRPVIVFTATIAPDGSFNARSGPDSMSGRVANGTMRGRIVGDICGFSFVADRGGAL